jgi:hypothetical protein
MRRGGRWMRWRSSKRFMPMDQWRWRTNASRLGLRDPRSSDGVMGGPRGARKRKSTWSARWWWRLHRPS